MPVPGAKYLDKKSKRGSGERLVTMTPRVEGAISGQRGHDRTFRVVCVLAFKFGLSLTQAWPLFLEWNEQCEQPWSDKELLHKLQDALKLLYHSRKVGI